MPKTVYLANYPWLIRPCSPEDNLQLPLFQMTIIPDCILNTDPYTQRQVRLKEAHFLRQMETATENHNDQKVENNCSIVRYLSLVGTSTIKPCTPKAGGQSGNRSNAHVRVRVSRDLL